MHLAELLCSRGAEDQKVVDLAADHGRHCDACMLLVRRVIHFATDLRHGLLRAVAGDLAAAYSGCRAAPMRPERSRALDRVIAGGARPAAAVAGVGAAATVIVAALVVGPDVVGTSSPSGATGDYAAPLAGMHLQPQDDASTGQREDDAEAAVAEIRRAARPGPAAPGGDADSGGSDSGGSSSMPVVGPAVLDISGEGSVLPVDEPVEPDEPDGPPQPTPAEPSAPSAPSTPSTPSTPSAPNTPSTAQRAVHAQHAVHAQRALHTQHAQHTDSHG